MEKCYTENEIFAIGEIQDELETAQKARELWQLIANMKKALAGRDIEGVLQPNGLENIHKILKSGNIPNKLDLRIAAVDFFNMLSEDPV